MTKVDVIIRPIVTEKGSVQQSGGQYAFVVAKTATKVDIKNAVRELYGVEVKEVKTMLQPGKSRMVRRGKEWVKRPVMKKALVTLKDKKTIDPNKFESKSKKK